MMLAGRLSLYLKEIQCLTRGSRCCRVWFIYSPPCNSPGKDLSHRHARIRPPQAKILRIIYRLSLIPVLSFGAYCQAAALPVIAIDIGHFRLHPGATSARGVPEFDFNKSLGKSIFATLAAHNATPLLIGDDGEMADLKKRTEAAAASNADFFLSIHHDSVQPQYLEKWNWNGMERLYSDRFSGFSLFVSRKNPHLEESLRCASMIGAALRQNGFHPSSHHAENIAGESKEWADEKNGVYYYDNLIVLKSASMPAVLLEAGVIVNRNEEEHVHDLATRQSIAGAVAQGLSDCEVLK